MTKFFLYLYNFMIRNLWYQVFSSPRLCRMKLLKVSSGKRSKNFKIVVVNVLHFPYGCIQY